MLGAYDRTRGRRRRYGAGAGMARVWRRRRYGAGAAGRYGAFGPQGQFPGTPFSNPAQKPNSKLFKEFNEK